MSKSHQVSRRQFLQATAAATAAAAMAGRASGNAGSTPPPGRPTPATGGSDSPVTIVYEHPAQAFQPLFQWAAKYLKTAITSRGIPFSEQPQGSDLTISLLLDPQGGKPESFSIGPKANALFGTKVLAIHGADPRGLAYGATEMADRILTAPSNEAARAALNLPAPVTESPANKIRGIFRMFVSEVEDKRWFYDREGWQKYFDMLVTHRFNRFNLSFGLSYDFSNGLSDTYTFFMYPFFVNVPGYNVRALAKNGQPLPADEMQKNLDTLKFISDQAALRGLQFNLGIWTHSYRWNASPNATYTIEGLNAQTQAPYSRDAMKMLIDTCPGITGITLRTHGESGVPEGSYDLWKIIMAGIMGHKNADGTPRTIELDMHAKTMTQQMIDTAHTTGMPVTISCKFWAEHMGLPYVQASIREAEMPKGRDATGLMALSSGTRSFLRYGIGDLIRKDRNYKLIHRVWPGTQRLLLWGDPLYAAEYGRTAHFAGMDGIEYFEPLSFKGRAGSSMNIPPAPDRSGYADASLRAEHDWEKYSYTFRLWGRLSYNPDAPAETWQRQLNSEFGPTAEGVETALANASRILPLITTAHAPAAANFQYWPEIYINQSIQDPNNNTYSEAPTPRVFGNVSSLDPQLFASVNQYVDSLLAGRPLAKYSPLDVARQLEQWSNSASKAATGLVEEAPPPHPAMSGRALMDARIAAGIGQFFAHKFRAGILWQLFNLSGHEPARAAATDSYKQAQKFWNELSDIAKIYLPDLTYGPDRNLRRHWSDRLADIDTDIAGMATRAAQPRRATPSPETIDKLIQSIINPITADVKKAPPPQHTPPETFKPGEAVRLWISGNGGTLFYRHLHQGERYTSLAMEKSDAGTAATIPADFTNSAFALQYYFALSNGDAAAPTLWPGFKENFTGTPYFVVAPV